MANKVILLGRLGHDPEVKKTRDGKLFANLSVATSERWRDRDGERKEKTTWHRVVIWNEKLAEIAEQYLRKGSRVYLEGKIETREYEKNGEKRYATDIVLNGFDAKLEMVGGRNDRSDDRDDRDGGRSSSGSSSNSRSRRNDDMDDDIPF